MKRILLLCSAGMSTSILVQKMKTAAKERGIECQIRASSETEAKNYYSDSDIILLGPQIRYHLGKVEAEVRGTGIKVAVIDLSDYGRMDGRAVLELAMSL